MQAVPVGITAKTEKTGERAYRMRFVPFPSRRMQRTFHSAPSKQRFHARHARCTRALCLLRRRILETIAELEKAGGLSCTSIMKTV